MTELTTDHPVHELVARRFSPYGFADRAVAPADLCSLFEAARWAPSSYNEQPWRFLVATRDDPEQLQRALACLVEANRAWARNAPVLVLACVSTRFARNGKPNKAAQHDLGLAAATLSLEATARGLAVHQMIGIDPARVRETYGVPDDVEPLTALAIGYAADPADLPDELAKRDGARRPRRPQAEFVFAGEWGQAAWR